MKHIRTFRIVCRFLVVPWALSPLLMAQTACLEGAASKNTFDVSFDRTNATHASFSCDLHVSASVARNVLESLRTGVLYHDTVALNRALRYPVTVVLPSSGKEGGEMQVEIHNAQEWYALQKSALNPDQFQTIASSWLGNITVVGTSGFNPGFIIGNGLVFFKYIGPDQLAVTHINLTS
jgi:hypothetical protein